MGFHSFCFCNFKWVKLKAKCFWEPHCSVSSGQENLQCTLLVLSLKNSFSFLSKSLPFSKHFMYSPRWLLAFLRLAISLAMLLNVFLISSKRTFFFCFKVWFGCSAFLQIILERFYFFFNTLVWSWLVFKYMKFKFFPVVLPFI